VNIRARLGPVGRLWPRKVRTRLTLIYAALFFAAGTVLLTLTYGLVASSLPTAPSAAAATVSSQELHALNRECDGLGTPPEKPKGEPPHAVLKELMTVVSGGLGWFMSGRVLRPVRVITETARRASQQHLGERLGLTGATDELKELADTFDDMLERLDAAFAAQRRFVANASHELRTPLTVMRTAIDVTLAKPSPNPRQLTDMAVRVRRSIDRAEGMVEALLLLAVSEQGRLTVEFADLATWAEDAIDAAAPDIERLKLHVDATLAPAETTGDPQLLERMVANLVDNAVRHNEPGGRIRLRTGSTDSAVYLEVANTGPFVPPESVPSLFEPFRRMEARTGPADGVGLGLSIARSVAAAHRATVTARSKPDGGLDISVVMPRVSPS
jgi:signal transduction histidine kinase